jgi:iron complex outermembrane receptor protein
VISGPGASVWGANAVNGVINIITKSAKDTQGGYLRLGGGTAEQGFGEFRYGGKIGDNLYYRAYGKGFTRDDTFTAKSSLNPNGLANDDWTSGSGGFRLDWQRSASDTATLSGDYFHTEAGRKDFRPQTTPPFRFINGEKEVSDGENVLARWSHQIDKDSSWALQAYFDRVVRTSTNGIIDTQWQTIDLDFQHQFPMGGRQKFIYGLGYRFVDVTFGDSSRDNGFILHRFRSDNNVFSGFLQDQITLIEDKLSLTLGSKFEHNDYTGFEYQPTARLLWTPTQRQSAWLAVSRAVRTPNATEVDPNFHFTQNPSIRNGVTTFPRQIGNPGFASEDMMAYELGYRVQAADNVSIDTALFYNAYNNLRVFVPPTTGVSPGTSLLLLPPENAMDGKTYGLEIGANWKVTDGWQLHGAYTFLEMQLHPNPHLRKSPVTNGAAIAAAATIGQSPEHQFYLRSSWDLPHNLEFDLTGRFVDGLSGFNAANVKGFQDQIGQYIALDARLSWRPRKDWELTIVGQNLFDNHHAEAGPNPRVASPLVEMPRGVYMAITYRW